jgi:hypothetical protein
MFSVGNRPPLQPDEHYTTVHAESLMLSSVAVTAAAGYLITYWGSTNAGTGSWLTWLERYSEGQG